MQALHSALRRLETHVRLLPTASRSYSALHATLGEAEIDEPVDDNRPTTPWIRTGTATPGPSCPVRALLRPLLMGTRRPTHSGQRRGSRAASEVQQRPCVQRRREGTAVFARPTAASHIASGAQHTLRAMASCLMTDMNRTPSRWVQCTAKTTSACRLCSMCRSSES